MPAAFSPFDRELQALADDERRASTARARLRRADRQIVDALSGSFLGTIVEVYETHAPVTVLTRTESAVRGTIVEVGADAIVLRTAKSRTQVLIRLASIEGLLESSAGHNRHVDPTPNGQTLIDILDRYSETNERIAVTTASGNKVMGHIDRVGNDQLVLRLDGRGDTMTIPAMAIDQVVMAS